MASFRMVRRRCAVRYLLCLFIGILVLISIHLSVFTDQSSNPFKFKQLIDRSSQEISSIKNKKQYSNLTQVILSKFINNSTIDYIKNKLNSASEIKNSIAITWDEIRNNPKLKTGNELIDNYGENDKTKEGEHGKGVTFSGQEEAKALYLSDKYHLNVYASDKIPLNRLVPDARFEGCRSIPFQSSLPSASVIIPFYDEWPSILLRTIYSIVNRSPKELLKEIILVDDGSQMKELKSDLDAYIDTHFPKGLVKIIRLPERKGLIQARLTGFRNSTGEVIIFFDSHMEVNIDWLQPLLSEVKADRTTIAMGTLDYIQQNSLEYKFYDDYMTRYGFDWRLVFFETFFRSDQVGEEKHDTRPGTVMVGAAYAIEKKFFEEMGTYDEGMTVWGGENLEMAWRIWLCGGRLVHVPCSHIGHVARSQPYTFPGGREAVEQYNYKRAIEVWMEPKHKELVYNYFPQMRDLQVGDLTERMDLKKRLNCKPFSWLLEKIWPELFVLDQNVTAWGSARNLNTNRCLDNHQYLFQAPEPLYAEPCHYQYAAQGFSMTKDKFLRTSLQCVVVKDPHFAGSRPFLEDCIIGPRDTWIHKQGSYIKHEKSGLCLDIDPQGPVMQACNSTVITQLWQFNTYVAA